MSEGGRAHGSYVRKVSEEIRRYTQDLLEDNRRLRSLLASYQVESQRLREEIASARVTTAEAEALRDQLRHAEDARRRAEDESSQLKRSLESQQAEHERLRRMLSQIDEDNRRYMDQFVTLEHQNNNLANLYVASYRLHGTLDHDEVIASVQEIVANLIGSEEMALFEVEAGEKQLRLATSVGVQPEVYEAIPLGQGYIGRAAVDGERTFLDSSQTEGRGSGEEQLTACVPLMLEDRITGVIAVFRLLPQKSGFEDVDHEIFDLLASHAATALYCTRLHQRALASNVTR
jgi:F0F1-type ATP synthase delta subunit